MKCWICGDNADSGEHLVKASDIRSLFGTINQKAPVFFHTDKKRNTKVGSAKSDLFKSKALICRKCNNERTQPYDKAWEKLSNYLLKHSKKISSSKKIYLQKIFPGKTKSESINIQLFFTKIFGCRIIEEKIPINVQNFSDAILYGKPIKDIYLSFHQTDISLKYAEITKIHAAIQNDVVLSAFWHYYLGEYLIRVLYFPVLEQTKRTANMWNPMKPSKVLKLGKKL